MSQYGRQLRVIFSPEISVPETIVCSAELNDLIKGSAWILNVSHFQIHMGICIMNF